MKKNNLNILDISIIVSVIAVIFSAFCSVNYRIVKNTPYKSRPAVITLITDDNIYGSISANDNVSLYNSDNTLGKILSVVKRKKYEFVQDQNGFLIKQLSENDNFEYVIRIETDLKRTNEGNFTKYGDFCASGSKLELKSDNLYFNAIVDNIVFDWFLFVFTLIFVWFK